MASLEPEPPCLGSPQTTAQQRPPCISDDNPTSSGDKVSDRPEGMSKNQWKKLLRLQHQEKMRPEWRWGSLGLREGLGLVVGGSVMRLIRGQRLFHFIQN